MQMSNEQHGIKLLYITNKDDEKCLLETLSRDEKSCVLSIENSIEKTTKLFESDFVVCMLHSKKEVEEFDRMADATTAKKLIVISDIDINVHDLRFKYNIVCKENTMMNVVATLDEVLKYHSDIIGLSIDEILGFIQQRAELICFHGSIDEIIAAMDYEIQAITQSKNILMVVCGDVSLIEISDVLSAVCNINDNIAITIGGLYKDISPKHFSVAMFVN